MADQIRAGVLLSLKDTYSPGIKKAGAETKGFESGILSSMEKINRATSGVSAKMAGVGLTIGTGVAVNDLINTQARMERLATSFDISTQAADQLKAKIYQVSQSPEIKVDKGEILGAMEQIAERTGDLKFAEENVRAIGLAIQATGATGDDIGGMFAEFQKMGLGAKDSMAALEALTVQGKKGAFTLQNLAGLGPRTIAAYSATGRTGTTALREMGAALQVIRQSTGSSEQAATSFEAVMRNLTDPVKQKELKKMGVAVRDQAGEFRPITTLLAEIVTKAKGSPEALGSIFDAEAMRAFNASIAEYQKSGAVTSLEEFLALQGDGNTILRDSARNAQTLKANITNLQGAFTKFADKNLTAPLGVIADTLNRLAEKPRELQRVFTTIAVGLAAVAAVKGLTTATTLVKNLKDLKAPKGFGGAGGATVGGTGGARPVAVMVTNWPAGGIGTGTGSGVGLTPEVGADGKGKPESAMKSKADKLRAQKASQTAALKGGLIAGGIQLALNAAGSVPDMLAVAGDSTLTDREKSKEIGGDVGGLVGGLGGTVGGALAGAALGSVVPVFGTAVGALVGAGIGMLGGWLGTEAGKMVGESLVPASKEASVTHLAGYSMGPSGPVATPSVGERQSDRVAAPSVGELPAFKDASATQLARHSLGPADRDAIPSMGALPDNKVAFRRDLAGASIPAQPSETSGSQLGKSQLPQSAQSSELVQKLQLEINDKTTKARLETISAPDYMKTNTGSSRVARGA